MLLTDHDIKRLLGSNHLLPVAQSANSPSVVHNRTPSFDFDIPAPASEASVTPSQPLSDPGTVALSPAVTGDPQLYVDKFVLNGETNQLRQNENSIYIVWATTTDQMESFSNA